MRAEAERLGVSGWVRNRRDGAVEARVTGEASAVDDLVAWVRQGPAAGPRRAGRRGRSPGCRRRRGVRDSRIRLVTIGRARRGSSRTSVASPKRPSRTISPGHDESGSPSPAASARNGRSSARRAVSPAAAGAGRGTGGCAPSRGA
ncbi:MULTISPECIES: acylphosphatase [Microbacterium]|uniref:acylphosphatase n=1 Tax=Microbacterium TaxID=33882 RepID=UPI0027E28918|nr:acylphosphatase [Microbacterium testaceum]